MSEQNGWPGDGVAPLEGASGRSLYGKPLPQFKKLGEERTPETRTLGLEADIPTEDWEQPDEGDKAPEPEKEQEEFKQRKPPTWKSYLLWWAVALGGILSAWSFYVWTPEKTTETYVYIAVGIVACGLGVTQCYRRGPYVSGKLLFVSLLTSGLLLGSFGLGLSSQVVIDGKPVPANSDQAYAYQLRNEMNADLKTMGDLDRFLTMKPEEARVAQQEITKANNTFKDLAQKWDARSAGTSWPARGEWKKLTVDMRDVASLGVLSSDTKLKALINYDNTIWQQASEQRNLFVQQALATSAAITQASVANGIK